MAPPVDRYGPNRYRWAPKVPLAGVAELADARDLGSRDESRGGSSPSARTIPEEGHIGRGLIPHGLDSQGLDSQGLESQGLGRNNLIPRDFVLKDLVLKDLVLKDMVLKALAQRTWP